MGHSAKSALAIFEKMKTNRDRKRLWRVTPELLSGGKIDFSYQMLSTNLNLITKTSSWKSHI